MRNIAKSPGEKIVTDVKRATRQQYSCEEKIRIVLDGRGVRTALRIFAVAKAYSKAFITNARKTSWKPGRSAWLAIRPGPRTRLTDAQVEKMGQDLLPEIARRRALYLKGLQRPSLANKTLVVVDDGVATGATLRASLRALRKAGAKRIILALPTAPPDMLPSLAKLADQTICLDQPRYFHAVGAAYGRFDQTTDDEVVAALQRCAVWQQGT